MDTPTVIPVGFRGAAARLTVADIDRAAAALGIDDRLVEAVAYVEADNHGFLDDGRPQLLFEAHQFHTLTGGQWDLTHPNISSPTWDATLYGAAGAHQYDRLAEAMALDRAAALQSATWGMFQELGANFEAVGFSSIDDFVSAMCAGEGRHIDVFVAHCIHFGLIEFLRSQDFPGFAKGYNGTGQINYYAAKLEAAYKAGKFPPLLPAPPTTPPPPPPPTTPTTPPPVLPSTPTSAPIAVTLRPGMERVFPGVVALDQDGRPGPVLTAADLKLGDASLATVDVSGPDSQGAYTIAILGWGVGSTTVTGPGVAWAVTIERQVLTQLLIDVSKAITRPIPAAAAIMAAMLMLPGTLSDRAAPLTFEFPVAATARAPVAAPALNTLERRCFEDTTQPYAIEGCLRWAHASPR